MNRFKILFALFLAVSCGTLSAAVRPKRGNGIMPSPGAYITEAVYYTSSTCANTSIASGGGITISSNGPVFVYAVNVASAGTSSPSFMLFDAQSDFQSFVTRTSTSDARTTRLIPFNVQFSSGLLFWSNSNACYDIIYYER